MTNADRTIPEGGHVIASATLLPVAKASTSVLAANSTAPNHMGSSGKTNVDQLLVRLNAAFGQISTTLQDNASNAQSTASALSEIYTSLTGRSQPHRDDAAGALAASLQQKLSSVTASLTGPLGQGMLRML